MKLAMELDDAYSNGAHIPNAMYFPPLWADNADAFRTLMGERAMLGLRYGDSPRQAYDLFLPQGTAKGTVMFVHGGYWRAFDRSSWSHLAAGSLERGWAVAIPSYDLCPDVRVLEITRQIAAAVQVVAERMDGPISLTGNSAGGHLVARMADRAVLPEAVGARLSHILPISPVADLRPLRRTSMNRDLHLLEAEAIAESPLFMHDRYDVPVTVWVGADERPAFLDQARWLAAAWGADHVIAPGRHHFDVIEPLIDPESDMVGRLTA